MKLKEFEDSVPSGNSVQKSYLTCRRACLTSLNHARSKPKFDIKMREQRTDKITLNRNSLGPSTVPLKPFRINPAKEVLSNIEKRSTSSQIATVDKETVLRNEPSLPASIIPQKHGETSASSGDTAASGVESQSEATLYHYARENESLHLSLNDAKKKLLEYELKLGIGEEQRKSMEKIISEQTSEIMNLQHAASVIRSEMEELKVANKKLEEFKIMNSSESELSRSDHTERGAIFNRVLKENESMKKQLKSVNDDNSQKKKQLEAEIYMLRSINRDIEESYRVKVTDLDDKLDNERKTVKSLLDTNNFLQQLNLKAVSSIKSTLSQVLSKHERLKNVCERLKLVEQERDILSSGIKSLKLSNYSLGQRLATANIEVHQLRSYKLKMETSKDESQKRVEALSAEYQNNTLQLEERIYQLQVSIKELQEQKKKHTDLIENLTKETRTKDEQIEKLSQTNRTLNRANRDLVLIHQETVCMAGESENQMTDLIDQCVKKKIRHADV